MKDVFAEWDYVEELRRKRDELLNPYYDELKDFSPDKEFELPKKVYDDLQLASSMYQNAFEVACNPAGTPNLPLNVTKIMGYRNHKGFIKFIRGIK